MMRRTMMRRTMMRRAGMYVVVAGVICLAMNAVAQENRSELSFQGMGFFTSSINGNGVDYSATGAGGALVTYRYHLNRWLSAEGAYGFSLNTQKYDFLSTNPFRLQSDIHQFTGSLVLNLPTRGHSRINPYFLLGGGAVAFVPTSNQINSLSNAQSQTKGAFVYGVGLNYAIHKGIAIRAEYRGLLYPTPDFGFGSLTTNAVTQTAEPSIGVAFRF